MRDMYSIETDRVYLAVRKKTNGFPSRPTLLIQLLSLAEAIADARAWSLELSQI